MEDNKKMLKKLQHLINENWEDKDIKIKVDYRNVKENMEV